MSRSASFVLAVSLLHMFGIAATASPRVAVTLSDLAPIVRAVGGNGMQLDVIMPAGTDPHGFSLSASHVQVVQGADLFVTANSELLGFEENLLATVDGTPVVVWDDYARNGARLLDAPGFGGNPHGFWLDYTNAKAIAKAAAEALIGVGMDRAAVMARLALFTEEVDAASAMSRDMARSHDMLGDTVIVAIPGVAYIATNAGFAVGHVLLHEGAGYIGGSELAEVAEMLRSGRAAGIVCPESMRNAKPGTISRQLARDTGSRVMYVQFLSGAGQSFLAQTYANAGALTTPHGAIRRAQESSGVSPVLVGVLSAVAAALVTVFVVRSRGSQGA